MTTTASGSRTSRGMGTDPGTVLELVLLVEQLDPVAATARAR